MNAVRVITCTADELCTLVRGAVRAELAQAKPAHEKSGFLTTREAATYCGMSVKTVRWHVAEGRLVPDSLARKGFGGHRFRTATLDAFLIGL